VGVGEGVDNPERERGREREIGREEEREGESGPSASQKTRINSSADRGRLRRRSQCRRGRMSGRHEHLTSLTLLSVNSNKYWNSSSFRSNSSIWVYYLGFRV
jgi:hypothetical protein